MSMVMFISWLFQNALFPMEATLLPIIALVSWLSQNANFPMEVTLLPMVTLVSWLPRNALFPIAITGRLFILLGITTSFFSPIYPVMVISPLFSVYSKSVAGFSLIPAANKLKDTKQNIIIYSQPVQTQWRITSCM